MSPPEIKGHTPRPLSVPQVHAFRPLFSNEDELRSQRQCGRKPRQYLMHLSMLCPYQCYAPPPLYGDRWGIGGDLTHRMCQIPHPSITIQCQIPTLYIHTRICAGTRANACAGQKPHPWGVIPWRIPYQAPPLSPTGGVGRNIDRRIRACDWFCREGTLSTRTFEGQEESCKRIFTTYYSAVVAEPLLNSGACETVCASWKGNKIFHEETVHFRKRLK